jgi:hypothetical protein
MGCRPAQLRVGGTRRHASLKVPFRQNRASLVEEGRAESVRSGGPADVRIELYNGLINRLDCAWGHSRPSRSPDHHETRGKRVAGASAYHPGACPGPTFCVRGQTKFPLPSCLLARGILRALCGRSSISGRASTTGPKLVGEEVAGLPTHHVRRTFRLVRRELRRREGTTAIVGSRGRGWCDELLPPSPTAEPRLPVLLDYPLEGRLAACSDGFSHLMQACLTRLTLTPYIGPTVARFPSVRCLTVGVDAQCR